MKRFVAALILSFGLLVPVQAARYPFMDSVVGLQTLDMNKPDPKPTICTAGRVAPDLYLTAYHCVDDKERVYFINSHTAGVVDSDPANDLALVRAYGSKGPSLKLASEPVSWGDVVLTAGRPMGGPLFFFKGRVARPEFQFEKGGQTYVLFNMAVAGGQSGSPIVNKSGRLVSVMQIGLKGFEPFSQISGGVTFTRLHKFLSRWV